jgi:DNA polymerase-4
MERTILHSDINSCYASIECLYHPELRDKPVAVCGDVEQRHGIILAKNQPAKKYGIATGEAIWQAKQKCPNLITVPAHYDLYIEVSKAIRAIYARYTDQIEPFGLDENWLDISGCTSLFGSGEQVAQEIRETVKTEIGVTVSVGVAWNKIFAKLGSDMKKPDAVTIITKDNFKEKVWLLPASDLLYVGPATTRKLSRFGIHTIGELACMKADFLHGLLGKWGEYLWCFANGHDISPVANMDFLSAIKSIGNSMTTFRDVTCREEAWQVIVSLTESVAKRLRENGFRGRTVKLSLRDTNLQWQEAQKKLNAPCCTVEDIARSAMQLLDVNYNFSAPLRAIGVRACDLLPLSDGIQIGFFQDAERRERWERIEGCVDNLRGRFGMDAVRRAVLLGAEITGESDPLTHVVHPVAFFK